MILTIGGTLTPSCKNCAFHVLNKFTCDMDGRVDCCEDWKRCAADPSLEDLNSYVQGRAHFLRDELPKTIPNEMYRQRVLGQESELMALSATFNLKINWDQK